MKTLKVEKVLNVAEHRYSFNHQNYSTVALYVRASNKRCYWLVTEGSDYRKATNKEIRMFYISIPDGKKEELLRLYNSSVSHDSFIGMCFLIY